MALDLSYGTFQKVAPQAGGAAGLDLSYNAFSSAKVAPPTPSLFQRGLSAVKGYVSDSVAPFKTAMSAISHPISTFESLPSAFMNPYKAGITEAGQGGAGIFQDKGITNKIADAAHLVAGTLGATFSPVTGLFNIAEHTPIAKNVADVMNVPFTVAGMAGSFVTGKAFDFAKQAGVLSPQATDVLKAPFQSLASTAAQIVLGGKIMSKIGDYVKSGTEVTPEVAQSIIDEVKTAPETPTATGSLSYETFQAKPEATPAVPTPSESSITPATAKPTTRRTGVLPEVQGTGALKERGLSLSVEADAVAKNLTDNLGELPQYRQLDFAKQATDALDYVASNAEEAKAVAMGDKAPPRGLLPQAVFDTVRRDATERGDVQTLRDLANSKLTTQATEAGRQIAYLGYNKGDVTDAVDAIRQVQDARAEALKTKGYSLETEATSIGKVVRESLKKSVRPSWEEFVSSITCPS